MSYKLGVDVGGTFTDLILFDEEKKKTILAKVPSTLGNQAIGILNGLDYLIKKTGISHEQIDLFFHGTTVATNAILEGKGVLTALITTSGFRDVLHIMRQDRPKLYNFFARRPEALIPRHLRFEVEERTLFNGEIYKDLDEAGVLRIIKQLKSQKVAAVAVCLLHSYANPLHEQKIKEILLRECPEVSVSISSEVLPEIKEYERMSTTAINASVSPIVERYLTQLTTLLVEKNFKKNIYIMQSNGGVIPSAVAGEHSVSTVLSGPAAGVMGGISLAKQAGFKNLITMDMGGTSFDICLIDQGELKFTRDCEIGGHALRVPMIDMHTIGAGGGSIAWIDSGGMLKVGPHSAGAEPGPVCYGKGGTEPTVTDANLALCRINPDYFLGGDMEVDRDAALSVIQKKIADPLGMGVLEAAEGIIKVINASMVKGIRFVSVAKGYDPREFSMICFGGNGPVHAVELARELEIPHVLVPFAPGVNCAYGLLVGDFRSDSVRTYLKAASSDETMAEVAGIYQELEQSSREKMRADGVSDEEIMITRSLDIRYMGQGYELETPAPSGNIDIVWWKTVENTFHQLYERTYGFNRQGEDIEIVNLRIACYGLLPKPELNGEVVQDSDPSKALKGYRDVFIGGKYHAASIYDRDLLSPGASLNGPAVLEQKDSTTVLFPGDSAKIDKYRNIIITVGGRNE